jgi:hypothetical protein
VWFENRRVIDILRGIEASALRLRDAPGDNLTMEIDTATPAITLPFERPLYAPVRKPRIESDDIRPAGTDEATDPAALFEQVHVDPGPLRDAVRAALRRSPQVGLAELMSREPLTQGLAELVAYLSLRDESFQMVFDEDRSEQLHWTEPDGRKRAATLPRVTFTRTGAPR